MFHMIRYLDYRDNKKIRQADIVISEGKRLTVSSTLYGSQTGSSRIKVEPLPSLLSTRITKMLLKGGGIL